MSESVFIYMTCKDHAEADKIVKTLLDERLIACANVFAPHKSYYNWEGRVENEPEVAVLMKTKASQFTTAKDRIVALHSYECPCVVSWPIEQGHTPFMDWIVAETTT